MIPARLIQFALAVSLLIGSACAKTADTTAPVNAFFAMDTAVRRFQITTEEKLDLLKKIGYDGFSWNGLDATELAKAIRHAEDRDLKLFALYAPAPLTTSGLELPKDFDLICETLSKHGSLIWLYLDSKVYKPSDQSVDAVAVPALTAAADRAARHNVRLALYPHRDYWVETFADAIRVADKVDRANFGVSFNLCHSLYAGEESAVSELLQKAGKRLFMVTINGADTGAAGKGWDRLIRPLGQGTYEIPQLLGYLRKAGYSGPIGFQAFGLQGDPTEILNGTITAWRRFTATKQ